MAVAFRDTTALAYLYIQIRETLLETSVVHATSAISRVRVFCVEITISSLRWVKRACGGILPAYLLICMGNRLSFSIYHLTLSGPASSVSSMYRYSFAVVALTSAGPQTGYLGSPYRSVTALPISICILLPLGFGWLGSSRNRFNACAAIVQLYPMRSAAYDALYSIE